MSYCSQQNFIDAFGESELIQLTDRAVLGVIDAAVLAAAQGWADNLINSKIAARLSLPLSAPYPPRLVDIACDLTRYRLYKDQPTDQVRKAYDDAVRQLDAVRDGKELLGLDGAGAAAVSVFDLAEISSDMPVFGRSGGSSW